MNEIGDASRLDPNQEKALEGTRAYLRSIVDTVREPLLVLDADLRVVSASRTFYQTYRVVPGETEGRLVYELGDGQWDIPALRTLLEDVLPSQRAFDDFEVVHDFPGVGRRTMLLNARKTYQPGNHSEQILLALEDVTERRATEARLRETDERLRLLVEGARDHAMILLDANGGIVHWNTGAERITGWTEAEVLGEHGALFFTPEDRAAGRPEQEMATARESGRAEDKRWHLKKDGSRFFADGVLTSLRGEDGASEGGPLRGYAKVMRDATKRKQEQDALQAAFEREHRIADALQRPLLLEIAEDTFPGIALATRYEAALDEAGVGGDFFDAFALPGGQVAFIMADASGKGLSAAARTIQVKEVVRAFARESPGTPARVLARLNDFVCDTRYYDEQQEESFVCLTLVVLDPVSGAGRVASAGCEPPLIIRANRGGAYAVESPGLPLGIQPDEGYRSVPFSLAPGDTLLLCTDGLTEARWGREFLGYEGLTELAARVLNEASSANCDGTLRTAARAILEGARAFARGVLKDDACLLLARRCDAAKD